MKHLLAGPLLGLLLFSSSIHADDPAAGFRILDEDYPGLSLTTTLLNEDIVAFDGSSVDLFDPFGGLVMNLETLPSFVFGSFVCISPAEDFVLVGESSNGDLFRVELDGSGSTFVCNLPFNFDAVFEDNDHAIVSASTGALGSGNHVARVEISTGTVTYLALLAGASGPVTVDTAGNLYYGTSSFTFPAPLGSSDILRFDAAQLTGVPVLSDLDATLVAGGFDGAGALAFDPLLGDLYLAENNFGAGTNRVRRVTTSAALSPILVEGPPFQSISNLEFFESTDLSRMRAFQPECGGSLFYNTTDFFSVFERNRLVPLRPDLILTGPGTTGVGAINLHIDSGPPLGSAFLLYGPLSLYSTPEYGIRLKMLEYPLLFGLDQGTVLILPGQFALDGNGDADIPFDNTTGTTNLFAIQALFSDGVKFAGTSKPAFL